MHFGYPPSISAWVFWNNDWMFIDHWIFQADVTTPRLKDYHERLQPFVLWFIDGSSYIGMTWSINCCHLLVAHSAACLLSAQLVDKTTVKYLVFLPLQILMMKDGVIFFCKYCIIHRLEIVQFILGILLQLDMVYTRIPNWRLFTPYNARPVLPLFAIISWGVGLKNIFNNW